MEIFTEHDLTSSLQAGFPHAFWLAGRAYANGIGESRDYKNAVRLFEQGAALGSPLCKRDLALLKLEKSDQPQKQISIMEELAQLAACGISNLNILKLLLQAGIRSHRAQAIRWLQHKLVFTADWQAGYVLYMTLLFPAGQIPHDNEFLICALTEAAKSKPHARKALAFGLLCGALDGRCHRSLAIRYLEQGTTPNEIALAALVRLESAGMKATGQFNRAERSLFIATQSGSAYGQALLLRLTLQQTEHSADAISREYICRSLLEHLANYPMHADEKSLRIVIRWMSSDAALCSKFSQRLKTLLMRSTDLGIIGATVSLARLKILNGDVAGAIEQLRKAALNGHRDAAELLGLAEMRTNAGMSESEGLFWELVSGTKEQNEARTALRNLSGTTGHSATGFNFLTTEKNKHANTPTTQPDASQSEVYHKAI